MFDLFQSRRDYNEKCTYWTRDDRDKFEQDELVMRRIPSGVFYAKEATPEVNQSTIVGGAVMFDKTTVTLKTPDNINDLKNNDLVMYQNEKWIVIDVQKRRSREQQTYFGKDRDCSHFYYISLRR